MGEMHAIIQTGPIPHLHVVYTVIAAYLVLTTLWSKEWLDQSFAANYCILILKHLQVKVYQISVPECLVNTYQVTKIKKATHSSLQPFSATEVCK